MKIIEGMEEEYEKYVETNSNDPYSKCIVTFSEQWAELMEEKMEEGAKLVDIADSCMKEVDNRDGMGITGFMYGCSVSGLGKFWVHGEDLRKWHNKEWGAPEVEGTVNPAVIAIDVP